MDHVYSDDIDVQAFNNIFNAFNLKEVEVLKQLLLDLITFMSYMQENVLRIEIV